MSLMTMAANPRIGSSIQGFVLLAVMIYLAGTSFALAFARGARRKRQKDNADMVKHLRRSDFRS